MRRFKKFFVIGLVTAAVGISGFLFWMSRHYVVPILMYHQVEKVSDSQPNWVSPENFEWQMAYLKDHGYKVISLDDLVQAKKEGRSLPRRSVVITFDDGYENNYTQAYPILKKYGFPATIFVSTDRVNTKGRMTWEQMKQMLANGIEIGSHTRSESYLPDLSTEQQLEEIKISKDILQSNLGRRVDYFAYPIGGFSEGIKQIVKEAGYQAACATNRGYDRFNKDVYELNRIRLSDKDVRKDYLWIKLSGYYNLFRDTKSPY